MLNRVAGVIALSCVCGIAVAGYGFEPVAALAPEAVGARSVAVGDVSGDGRDDVMVLGGGSNPLYRDKVLVYVQTDGGHFTPPTMHSYGANEYDYGGKVRLADLDADGDQDIVVMHYYGLGLLRNEGGLQFTLSTFPVFNGSNDFDTMDVDLDGNLDIVVMSAPWTDAHYGDGAGGIRDRALFNIQGGDDLHLADMNNDGRRDLVFVAHERVRVHLHEDNGFSLEPIMLPMRFPYYDGDIAVSDFNGDGRMDIAAGPATRPKARIAIYEQGANGLYRLRRLLHTYGENGPMLVQDMDGNGHVDLVTSYDSTYGFVGLHMGRASGFVGESLFNAGPIGHVGAIGDLNHDGLKDVVVTNRGSVSYLRGRDSALEADLGVYLGLTNSAVAVRVDNHSSVMPSEQFSVSLLLDARYGPLSVGAMPEGCSNQTSWSRHDLAVFCQMEPLEAGSHRILTFPIAIPPRTTRNQLDARAALYPNMPDLRNDNNMALKRLLIPPTTGKVKR